MKKSLKTQLIVWFVLFACIPVLVGAVINAYFTVNEMRTTMSIANLNLNKEIANEIQRSMEHAQSLNEAVSVMPVVLSMQEEPIRQALIDLQKKNPQFELIAVLDRQGQQIARTSGTNGMRNDRVYFQKAIQGERFFSDAYISATTQALCVTVSAPIRDRSGALIGVVASDVSLGYLWEIADSMKIGTAGYIDIVDNKGMVLAHPDKEKIRSKESFAQYEYVQKAIGGEAGIMEAESSTNVASLITYAPIQGTRWGVIAYQPMTEIYEAAVQNAWMMLLIVVISILVSVLVSFKVAKDIVNPLRSLVEAANLVSKGDLSHDIAVCGAAEINELSTAFQRMIEHLRSLIMKTTEASETVSAASEELAASIEAIGRSAQDVAQTALQSAQKTNETAELSQRSVQVMQAMVGQIEAAAASVRAVAEASKVSQDAAGQGSVQSGDTIRQISSIQHDVNTSAGVIDALGEKSRQIGQIVDTISGIAGQTNLLALNAAIEAARAGEHGKGFAVVAEEVGKLAEQSEAATGEIAEIIQAIRNETMTAVGTMEKGCREVEAGVISVRKTAASFDDIQRAIANVNEQVAQILEISAKQKEGSASIQRTVLDIAGFLQTNAEGVERMAAVSDEQNTAVQEVKAAAADLAKMATELRGEISKFSI